MGAVQFIENMDRTTLTITDEDFEKNVEAAVSAIAEKHQANSPLISQQPTFNEKVPFVDQQQQPHSSSRRSHDGDHGYPARSTSLNDRVSSTTNDDNAPMSGIFKTIQKPLSTIGRIFSDDPGQSSSHEPAPPPRLTQGLPPPPRVEATSGEATSGEATSNERPTSRHALPAEEAAARQASAEAAEAQRLSRAEHNNVVETLAGMFPDLDKDIISDVVHQKEGR